MRTKIDPRNLIRRHHGPSASRPSSGPVVAHLPAPTILHSDPISLGGKRPVDRAAASPQACPRSFPGLGRDHSVQRKLSADLRRFPSWIDFRDGRQAATGALERACRSGLRPREATSRKGRANKLKGAPAARRFRRTCDGPMGHDAG